MKSKLLLAIVLTISFASFASAALVQTPVNQGGTGVGTFTSSRLIYGNGTAPLSSVATTSVTCTGSATCTGFTVIGSSPITISATGGSSFAYPFPLNATSTTLTLSGGAVIVGSTTLPSLGTGLVKVTNGLLGTDTSTYLTAVTADSPLSGSGTSGSHLVLSTAGTWSGLAGTATALAANPTNCSAGNYPLGIDASGNVENCTAAGTVTAVTGTWPIASSGGTTPTISWSGLASSTALSNTAGLLYATGVNTFGAVSTSSAVRMDITGNAGTATILQNARTINGVSFNGSANITVASTTLLTDQNFFTGATTTMVNAHLTGNLQVDGQFFAPVTLVASGNTTINGNLAVTGSVDFDTFTSAILLTGAGGDVAEYAGASCTNQFVRSLSALGAATCATVGASDVSLANLTATDSTLTFSGTYTGATARTIGLNLGNTNTWTATQTFSNGTYSALFTGGNVGIGTTTANSQLTIHKTGGTSVIALTSTGDASSGFQLQHDTSRDTYLWNYENGAMYLGVNNGVALSIQATKNIVAAAAFTVTGLTTLANASSTQMSITSSGRLYIPAGTNPDITATGDLAINTTAASSSLRFFDGTAERSLYNATPRTFTFASSTIAYYGGTAATTTIPVGTAFRPETWLSISCYSNAGTGGLRFGDGTNWMEYVPVTTTTGNFVTLSSNAAFIRGEARSLQIRQETTVTRDISCTVLVRDDAD